MNRLQFHWVIRLFFYVFGIYGCFLSYGVFMEQISTTTYGATDEKFSNALFVVLSSTTANIVVAFFWLVFREGWKPSEVLVSDYPLSLYAKIAIFGALAMVFSITALDYIDYPTQVLAKTAKPLAIIVVSFLLTQGRGEYGRKKTITAVFITIGIAIFMLNKDSKYTAKDIEGVTAIIGQLLLLGSLACDGAVAFLQQGLKRPDRKRPVAGQQMLLINGFSWLLMLVLLVFSGKLFTALAFIAAYPGVIWTLALLGASMSAGQVFIYLLLADFDPLVCSLVTTTRKFFTILVSVIMYRHLVHPIQWLGVGLVFFGLLFPNFLKNEAPKAAGSVRASSSKLV